MSFLLKNPPLTALIIFIAFSVPIVWSDIKSMLIPDFIIYLGIITMGCYRAAVSMQSLMIYIGSGILAALIFILVKYTSRNGLGLADIKYSALCGIYAGPIAVFVGFIFSSILGAIYHFIMVKLGRLGKKDKFPFTPFLAAGTLLVTVIPLLRQIFAPQ